MGQSGGSLEDGNVERNADSGGLAPEVSEEDKVSGGGGG